MRKVRKPKSSKVLKIAPVKKEMIKIDSDTDTDEEEVGGRMLALYGGEDNASSKLHNSSAIAEIGETSKTGMEIVCADDSSSGLEFDMEYKKYLAICNETNLYLPQSDTSPMRLMYTVEYEATVTRSKGRAAKRLKTENGKADNKSISGTIKKVDARLRKKTDLIRLEPTREYVRQRRSKYSIKSELTSNVKEIKQKKGESLTRRKIDVSKNKKTDKSEPRSSVKGRQEKKEDARQGRKIPLSKNSLKACEKENEQSSAKSLTVLRASKRLKSENGVSRIIPPVVNTKRKKGEEALERKIHVTEKNVKSKSTSHAKDKLRHSFKPCKEEESEEETLSSVDKSYAYFLAFLRNGITTVCEPNRKVNPVKDMVCLYDPDIIAVSDYPFSDGGKSPFEANKDGKVIDVEDGINPDNILNSSFSKKLMEVLREPYDKNEFVKLYHQASHKRPLTRYRQLRNGTEIEYIVHNELTHSYLQDYPDFKKILRRYQKDHPRALNLLRGFLFYLENIILEGAFKPWKYEEHLMRECKILYASSNATPDSS